MILLRLAVKKTVVFTKKQFRIDREGNVMKGGPKKKNKNKSDKGKRGVRGRARSARP